MANSPVSGNAIRAARAINFFNPDKPLVVEGERSRVALRDQGNFAGWN